ncbi:hypothetical protein CMT37_05095 [Elizabethkingia anophelis]|nr:hypothetical protein [Elizabethkingia anophelis]
MNYNEVKMKFFFLPLFIVLACFSCALINAQENKEDSLVQQIEKSVNREKAWQLKFSGFIQADYMFDAQQMKSKDGFVSPLIDMPQKNSESSYFSIKQSQLRVDIQNPQIDISGKVEVDFYGANDTSAPRLRQAYITWKQLMFGQSWSNFSDVDTWCQLLDFVGPNASMSTRQVQLRYTTKLKSHGLLSLSLEDPDAPSITLPKDSLLWKKKVLYPSFTAAYRYGTAKNYIRIAGIFSPISYEGIDGNSISGKQINKTVFGAGINLSGAYYLKSLDNIKFQTSYGVGYTTNNIVLHNMGYDMMADINGNLKLLPMYNILFMYEHWWNLSLSSTIYYSDSKLLRRSFMPSDVLNNFQNTGINVIYHPQHYLRIGMEFTYGRVENIAHEVAKATRCQLSTSFTF